MKFDYKVKALSILAIGILSTTSKTICLSLSQAQVNLLKQCSFFKDKETISTELVRTVSQTTDLPSALSLLAKLIENPTFINNIHEKQIAEIYYLALFVGAPQLVLKLLNDRYFSILQREEIETLKPDSAICYIPLRASPFRYGLPIKWDTKVSEATISSSWHNWRDRYIKVKPELKQLSLSQEVLEKHLKEAIDNGIHEVWPYRVFLTLPIAYCQLTKYPHAKTPEEAYPQTKYRTIEKRRRDLAKVYSLLGATNTLSPVVIARVSITADDKNPVLIKLDGSHRIIAAALRNSPVAVCFINLSFQQFLVNHLEKTE